MRRQAASIGMAIAAHAGIAAWLLATRVATPPEAMREIDVSDIQGYLLPDEVPTSAVADPNAAHGSVAATMAVAVPRSLSHAGPSPSPAAASSLEDTRPPPDANWSIWSVVASAPTVQLTFPSASALAPAAGDSLPDSAPRPASTTGGLREGLAARDHELGLGPAGPVVGAVESATRTSTAPVEGFALFEVHFDETGAVHEVHIVDARNERDSWATVADGIAAGLKATHIRVPKGAHGYSVKVRVESAWLNADGTRPGPWATCVWPAPCNPDPKVNRTVVTPTPLMIGLGGNIPDTPVAPSRQVHARIVEEHAY